MKPYRCSLLALPVAAGLALAGGGASAQTSSISLDGTLPHGRTDVVTTPGSGPAHTIAEDLGWRSGANLFHSFRQFNIGVGESATFTADPSLPALSNVIARVTGRDPATGTVTPAPSQIDGALRSEIAGADVFLLNPHGILFGPNGSVDVPKSLHLSTAHALRFDDDTSLSTVDPAAPVLSSAAPEAFGFLAGREAADVQFAAFPGFTSNVAVKTGATLSVSGGDVTATNRVFLRAPSGRVQLAALGSAGAELPLDFVDYHPNPAAAAELGEVRLADGATAIAVPTGIDAPQGTVVIRGGRFGLVSSTASQSTVRAGDRIGGSGPSIDVEVAGEIEIGGAALLRAEGQGVNPSGGARLEADRIEVRDGARVESRVAGSAQGGDLVFEAWEIEVASGGQLVTTTQGSQPGGDIVIRGRSSPAESVTLDGGQILSTATSTGAGGHIGIETETLTARNGRITASSSLLAAAGGGIEIAAEQVDLLENSQIASTNQIAAAPAPDAIPGGDVAIRAPNGRIRIADGASVTTVSSGPHPGGSIEFVAEVFEVVDGGVVEASARAAGAGGAITIGADRVELFRSGDGVAAGRVSAVVAPEPEDPIESASGAGGDIAVTAGSVALRDGGQLSTTTLGSGSAGSVSVVASGDVVLAGEQPGADGPEPSGIFSRSETAADGGDVVVTAGSIEVVDGGEISTRAITSGTSGDVALTAQQTIRVAGEGTQGSVVTARGVNGSGGDIALTAPRVEIEDGGSVDVSTSGSGQGGTLSVDADEVLVAGRASSGLRASLAAEAGGSGDAGGVHVIVSEELRIGEGGQITAISLGQGGSPGDVTIEGGGAVIVEDGGLINAESRDLQLAETATPGSVLMLDISRLTVKDGGEISVRGLGVGDGGDIAVAANEIEILHGTLTAEAAGVGGNIDLVAAKLVHIADSVVTATASAGEDAPPGARGGNITIDPPAVVINRSQIEARGEGLADGGNFSVVASAFLLSADSTIDFTSDFGVDGTVVVDAPQSEIAGDLAALPEDFLDASALLEAACLARDQAAGSFSVRPVGSLPAPPDAPLSARTGAPDAGGACPAP